jgi:hypothetical protein
MERALPGWMGYTEEIYPDYRYPANNGNNIGMTPRLTKKRNKSNIIMSE